MELNRTGLIDTAGIDPDIFEAVNFGLIATATQLDRQSMPRFCCAQPGFLHIFEGYLFTVLTPCMRQDGVWRWLLAEEIFKAQGFYVEETHRWVRMREWPTAGPSGISTQLQQMRNFRYRSYRPAPSPEMRDWNECQKSCCRQHRQAEKASKLNRRPELPWSNVAESCCAGGRPSAYELDDI